MSFYKSYNTLHFQNDSFTNPNNSKGITDIFLFPITNALSFATAIVFQCSWILIPLPDNYVAYYSQVIYTHISHKLLIHWHKLCKMFKETYPQFTQAMVPWPFTAWATSDSSFRWTSPDVAEIEIKKKIELLEQGILYRTIWYNIWDTLQYRFRYFVLGPPSLFLSPVIYDMVAVLSNASKCIPKRLAFRIFSRHPYPQQHSEVF